MSWLRRLVGGDEPPSGSGIDSIRFDLPGWKRTQRSSEAAKWRDAEGDVLKVRFAGQPAPFLAESSDITSLRERYRREAAASAGAIVSVDALAIHGVPAVEVITKFERRPAYSYQGILALAFESSHCMFVIEALERGTTGVREAIVTSHVFARGELEIREQPGAATGELVGWFLDPYLESYAGPILHSLSDDERLGSRARFSRRGHRAQEHGLLVAEAGRRPKGPRAAATGRARLESLTRRSHRADASGSASGDPGLVLQVRRSGSPYPSSSRTGAFSIARISASGSWRHLRSDGSGSSSSAASTMSRASSAPASNSFIATANHQVSA
jgi:hypothetical protein